ncbi:MAG: protein kinase domain-containing protein, partial [Gemmatimonadaceae bacterium]
MNDRLRGSLSSHYEIDREIGRGGMASVFLARDVKHGRQVAIKVLHPELAAAVGPARFLREIETAAKLTHPHILSLHDSGERDGLLYYVMPYIEGESLRDRLTRQRQLPLEEALRFTADIADALGFAHEHGVVHRDIKPENILLSGRHAIVADFGIARAVERAGGDTLTHTGVTLGTPQYMSPEQASGQTDIDGRADIYALGCVLYEMLAGEPPFSGPTMQSIVAKHLTASVPSVRTLRPTIPARIDRVIARALAKSPADRYADAGSLLRDLETTGEASLGPSSGAMNPLAPASKPKSRRPTIAVAALTIAVAITAWLGWRVIARPSVAATTSFAAADSRALAVLPFADVGAAAESSYFADGITDEIIDAVSRIPGLRVISRTSAFAFKEKRGLTMRQIADSLDVGTILEGSVRRDRNHLRVIARLVDVVTDSQLLTRDFDRELRDVFAVQNEIAQDIASALRLRLTSATPAMQAPLTKDVEAYDLFLRGRAYWYQRTPPSLREAVRLFEAAIARDPNFVGAYVGLSDALTLTGIMGGVSPRAVRERTRVAAERALQLDSTNGAAHAALGHALFTYYHDWDNAEAHLRRARSLDSSDNWARLYLAIMLNDLGRFDESLALLEEAAAHDPLAAPMRLNLGRIALAAGRTDLALQNLRMAVSLNP